MRSLVPCPSCRRHVESVEATCPFCATPLVQAPDERVCQGPCSGHVSPHLARAALIAVGATLLCASCFRSVTYHYGTPSIPDTGQGPVDAGSQDDAAPDTSSTAGD